jgi:hypothetical protein
MNDTCLMNGVKSHGCVHDHAIDHSDRQTHAGGTCKAEELVEIETIHLVLNDIWQSVFDSGIDHTGGKR